MTTSFEIMKASFFFFFWEVARENCQTAVQAWCLRREVGREEEWLGDVYDWSTILVKFGFLSLGHWLKTACKASHKSGPVLVALPSSVSGWEPQGIMILALIWGGSRLQRGISGDCQSPMFTMAANRGRFSWSSQFLEFAWRFSFKNFFCPIKKCI